MASLFHGRYDILERLGEGGMGTVYRALDVRLGRPVALKVIHPGLAGDAQAQARLVREARLAASLNHPNICTVHEVFDVEPGVEPTPGMPAGPVVVMEFVEGEALSDRLARLGRLPLDGLLDIGGQIADGLADAHARRVVHRDLKPHNVVIGPQGRVKILDFGLAKTLPVAADPAAETLRAETVTADAHGLGTIRGTVPYMSPEQVAGRTVDARSDIFSFGVMLYEMASGERPFTADTAVGTFARILEAEPRPLSALRPDLPPGFIATVERCLRKDPAARFSSARELAAELTALRQEPVGRLTGAAPRPRTGRGRVRAAAGAAAAALALLAAGVWVLQPEAPPPPAAAHRQVTFAGDVSFPTISPDGSFLAYVRGEPWGRSSATLQPLRPQKIMIQDLAGGGQPLEVGECRVCGALQWSPDGATLLATDPPHLVLIPRLGGTPRRLDGGRLAVWSPDGLTIATTGSGRPRLTFVDPATDRRRDIDLVPDVTFLTGLDWSPSGQRLAVATGMTDGRSAVWLVAPDGAREDRILDDPARFGAVQWAPAGDAVYVLRETGETYELLRLRLDRETGPRTGEAEVILAGVQAGPNFALARDGRSLVYSRELHYSNLWSASLDRRDRETPPTPLTVGTSRDLFPAISPDGTRIAWVRAEGVASNLHVMPIAGGPASQLTFQMHIQGAPAWSPDGRRLAFCAGDATTAHVWTIALEGGSPRDYPATRCTTAVSEVPVTWFPRPEILYQRPGNRNYHVLDPASASERALIADDSVGWLFAPHASPDGSTIAAFWNHRDGRGIWLIPPDGGAPRLVWKQMAWPTGWSADARVLYAYVHAPDTDIVALTPGSDTPALLRRLAGQRIGLVPATSPNGRTVIYSAYAIHSDAWIVRDFDPRAR